MNNGRNNVILFDAFSWCQAGCNRSILACDCVRCMGWMYNILKRRWWFEGEINGVCNTHRVKNLPLDPVPTHSTLRQNIFLTLSWCPAMWACVNFPLPHLSLPCSHPCYHQCIQEGRENARHGKCVMRGAKKSTRTKDTGRHQLLQDFLCITHIDPFIGSWRQSDGWWKHDRWVTGDQGLRRVCITFMWWSVCVP